MGRGVDHPQLRQRLGVPSFEQRWPWIGGDLQTLRDTPVSYTHLRAHETVLDLVCRLLLEKKNN